MATRTKTKGQIKLNNRNSKKEGGSHGSGKRSAITTEEKLRENDREGAPSNDETLPSMQKPQTQNSRPKRGTNVSSGKATREADSKAKLSPSVEESDNKVFTLMQVLNILWYVMPVIISTIFSGYVIIFPNEVQIENVVQRVVHEKLGSIRKENEDLNSLKKQLNDIGNDIVKMKNEVKQQMETVDSRLQKDDSKITLTLSKMNECETKFETDLQKTQEYIASLSNGQKKLDEEIKDSRKEAETVKNLLEEVSRDQIKTTQSCNVTSEKVILLSKNLGDLEQAMTQNSSKTEERMEVLKTSLDSILKANEDLNSLRNQLNDTGNDFVKFKNEVKQQMETVDSRLQKDDSKITLTLLKMNESETKFGTDLQKTQEYIASLSNGQKTLDEEIKDSKKEVETVKNLLEEVSRDQIKTTQSCNVTSEKVMMLSKNLSDLEQAMTQNSSKTEERMGVLTASLANVEVKLKETTGLQNKVTGLEQYYSQKVQPNLFQKDSFQLAFLLLFLMVLGSILCQYRMYLRLNDEPMTHANRGERNAHRNSNEILKMVQHNPPLDNAVCIISFDEGRKDAHRQLLDSVNLASCRVVLHVIRRHADIPKLPKCKVYLMCTEFSERHVIIEEPGLGLGDLHRTTYDAVQKMGGKLIILYTKDPGSRNLMDGKRYNQKIYCVTHQSELVALDGDNRFYSVYDTLSTFQKRELRQKIMQCLS